MAIRSEFLFVFCIVLAMVKIGESMTMEEFRGLHVAVFTECKSKHPVNDNQIKDFLKGKISDDKDVKCFINCGMELMKTMKDGVFQYEEAKKQVPLLPEELREISETSMEACKTASVGISDHCEAAFVQMQCFQKLNPKFFSA